MKNIENFISAQLADTVNAPDCLLQYLCALQQQYSHIPEEAVALLSSSLQIPEVQIYGFVDFYTFLHRDARGDFDILFSDSITDRMLGSLSLLDSLCEKLDIEPGIPRADGRVTVDVTSCTGICDQGPAILVNGLVVSRLDEDRIGKIAELVEAATPLSDWPQAYFTVVDNIQRSDILLNDKIINGSAIACLFDNDSDAILTAIEQSGLRGRGGAGFNTAMKWRFCRDTEAAEHYVVCNADEGEPGTFKDRVLLNSYADNLFEGMTLCAGVIGAKKGYLYLRGEYFYLLEPLQQTLQKRREHNLLGSDICSHKGFDFDIDIHLGAGAYICGEESALIESLEGKRGIPRKRPPFPVTSGFRNQPTVVNNVETFIAAAKIAVFGADWFRSVGTGESAGTKLLSISGDCTRPGIYEYPFGVSIRQVLEDCGAADVQAAQVAGAAGSTIPPDEFDRKIAFEDVSTGGSFMVFSQQRELLDMVQNFAHFFCHESCGFCTPCRVGGALMKNLVDKVMVGHATRNDLNEMQNIGHIMQHASHCGLGVTAPKPVLDTLEKFPDIYAKRLANRGFEPAFDLDAALEESRQITGRDDAEAHIAYEPLLDTAEQDKP
jgi:[NiFe] hydrogenase diaphorase moiety large subunit